MNSQIRMTFAGLQSSTNSQLKSLVWTATDALPANFETLRIPELLSAAGARELAESKPAETSFICLISLI